MLTIKQITENTEAVLRGLEKKHFKNAKETIDQVIALNNKRRSTQNELDKNLAEVNSLSRTIGQLMKEGKKEEAETARARVAELKEGNKELDAAMTQAATDMQNVLYTSHFFYDVIFGTYAFRYAVIRNVGDGIKYILHIRIYRNHAADSSQRCFRLWHRTASGQRRTDVSL